MPTNTLSLSKYIAQSGFASRRKSADLVKLGYIYLNDEVCINPGERVDILKDKVTFHKAVLKKHQLISLPQDYDYLILNKPIGYLCTTDDPFERKTIYELLPKDTKVYPVGRLDQESRGLIILTNDGQLNNHLTNPKFHIPKTYEVTVLGKVHQIKVDTLESFGRDQPMKIADIVIKKPAQLKILQTYYPGCGFKPSDYPGMDRNKPATTLQFILHEGKKRQIRRMCAEVNLHVLDLKRVKIGDLELGDLKEGEYRKLTPIEITELQKVRSN